MARLFGSASWTAASMIRSVALTLDMLMFSGRTCSVATGSPSGVVSEICPHSTMHRTGQPKASPRASILRTVEDVPYPLATSVSAAVDSASTDVPAITSLLATPCLTPPRSADGCGSSPSCEEWGREGYRVFRSSQTKRVALPRTRKTRQR